MAGQPAHATFDRTDATLVVELAGELHHDSVPELAQAIVDAVDAVDPGCHEIRIGLGSVEFCDSSGLSMFVRLQQEADRRGAHLVLSNPSPILRATFAVCGLSEHLHVDRTEQATL